ncbi:hypothetical protein GW17_00018757 [Ensete ventricosum]|nr:hypothetical protein GW17_00018757 [Ensete ventricosum]
MLLILSSSPLLWPAEFQMDCSGALSTKPVPPTPPNPSSANLPESPTPQRKIWIKPTAPAPRKQQQQRQRRKEGSGWDEKRVVGFVDYDEGERRVSTEINGARKDEIPAKYRLRVDGSRWQKDWKLSEVVDQVMRLRHWEDIDGVLNRWAGRFARKNFPLLIRVPLNSPASDKTHTARYIPVRQLTGTRTGRYRAVPLKSAVGDRLREKIDRRRSIEEEKGKRKKKKKIRKKKKRRRRNTSLARPRCPQATFLPAHGRRRRRHPFI